MESLMLVFYRTLNMHIFIRCMEILIYNTIFRNILESIINNEGFNFFFEFSVPTLFLYLIILRNPKARKITKTNDFRIVQFFNRHCLPHESGCYHLLVFKLLTLENHDTPSKCQIVVNQEYEIFDTFESNKVFFFNFVTYHQNWLLEEVVAKTKVAAILIGCLKCF